MKTTITEHLGCFAIFHEAETIAEAALLVRFGMNSSRDVTRVSTMVTETGVNAQFMFSKFKTASSYVRSNNRR